MAKFSTWVKLNEKKQVVFNNALSHVCRWSRLLSAATWFNLDQDERPIHYYVLFWLIALIPILSFAPTSGWPGLVLVGLAFYRLQDLIFSTLDNAFLLTTRSSPSKKYDLTLVILALVNIIQIVLIFAIAYLILTGCNPKLFYNPPTSRFDEFYLSWVSLPPLGGGASPERHHGEDTDDYRRRHRPTDNSYRHRSLPIVRSQVTWDHSAVSH